MSIGERVRECRRNNHISQEYLADQVGVHANTIRKWEKGLRSPRTEDLSRLASALNTTVAYLSGEIDDPTPSVLDQILNNTAKYISDHAGEFPPPNPAAPEITQEEAMSILRGEKPKAELPESNARPVKTIKVPFFSGIVKACCGDGNGYLPEDLALELEKQGSFDVPVSELEGYMWQVGPGGFGTIRVEGSSMEPRIHDGDIILYGDLPRSNGNFVLVRYDDRLIVRGIYDDHNGHYTLKALNPAYKDIHVDTEDESKTFFIYGKVIRRISMENLADGMM